MHKTTRPDETTDEERRAYRALARAARRVQEIEARRKAAKSPTDRRREVSHVR